jgi:arylsulfatase A-like enzyme
MVGFQAAPLRVPTLPQVLRQAGYATVLAGRHMHQIPYDEPYGFERQILGSTYMPDDDYARFLAARAPDFGGIHGMGLSFNGWHARPWPLAEDLHPTSWVVARARELLAGCPAEQPLFLAASFFAPHPPLIPPPWHFEYYRGRTLPPAAMGDWVDTAALAGIGAPIDAPRVRLEGEALRLAQAGYFGLIHHLDDQLYWAMEEFKGRSQRAGRPWVIVFTSDHGEMLGDHGYFRKCEPYEGSARIPVLIQGSADLGLRPGLVCRQPVCLEDLMPTLLTLAGIAIPPTVDGVSLVPVLRGEGRPLRPWLHAEHAPCYSREQAFHSLTDGRQKYIWRPHDGSEQLFDLDADPCEQRDLARNRRTSATLRAWRQRLVRHLAGRPEGFSDGTRLKAGRPYPALMARPT